MVDRLFCGGGRDTYITRDEDRVAACEIREFEPESASPDGGGG